MSTIPYPAKFPYVVKKNGIAFGWRKICRHCDSSVEFPIGFSIFLNKTYLCEVTNHARDREPLCNEKCAAEYFWKEFCIRKLNGQFR